MARDSFRRSLAAPAPAHPNPAHALASKAQRVYERIYCQRGEVENRIKELFDVALDRTSCSRFLANQLRVLLAASAYMLLQELRLAARGTAWARTQVNTLWLELLKIGVQVVASVRWLVLHLPAAFPYRDGWRALALKSGASPGGDRSTHRHQSTSS